MRYCPVGIQKHITNLHFKVYLNCSVHIYYVVVMFLSVFTLVCDALLQRFGYTGYDFFLGVGG